MAKTDLRIQALDPGVATLAKIASIAVHVDEFLSDSGHPFDRAALGALLNDPDVRQWLEAMDKLALVPKKRSAQGEGSE